MRDLWAAVTGLALASVLYGGLIGSWPCILGGAAVVAVAVWQASILEL